MRKSTGVFTAVPGWACAAAAYQTPIKEGMGAGVAAAGFALSAAHRVDVTLNPRASVSRQDRLLMMLPMLVVSDQARGQGSRACRRVVETVAGRNPGGELFFEGRMFPKTLKLLFDSRGGAC